MSDKISFDSYALMQSEKPMATYKKVTPSRVSVLVINPFNDKIEEVVIKGNPRKNELSCFIPLWSEREHLYFKRANSSHIDAGRVVLSEYPKEEDRPVSPNYFTDEQIEELVSGPFMTLKRTIEKVTSEAAMGRFVEIAESLDRPTKTMRFLQDRLSLIQFGNGTTEESENEDED